MTNEQSKLQQIPADISGQELADWLEWAIEYDLYNSVISEKDIEIIRRCTRDESLLVRAVAIGYLANNGPCAWDEFELWGLDTDENVRRAAAWAIEFDSEDIAAAVLCRTDAPRCVKLLESMTLTYGDGEAAYALYALSRESQELFDLTWAAAERLLASGDINVTSPIIISYFESIIPKKNWGPEDPYIRPWIESGDISKKFTLLTIANYLKLKGGKLREIVEALAKDQDNETAAAARSILRENPVSVEKQKKKRQKS